MPVNCSIIGSDDKLHLNCLVLNGSKTPFSVTIAESSKVYELMTAIKKEKEPELDHLAAGSLTLWKLSSPIPCDEIDAKLGHVQSLDEILGRVELDSFGLLLDHFSSAPTNHVHIIVELPHEASQKRCLSPMEEDSRVTKRGRIAESFIDKKWFIYDPIRETDTDNCYYLDPRTQVETQECLESVLTDQFAFLWGARGSGKTTRLFWLRKELRSMGYHALYISFEDLDYLGTTDLFWTSFIRAVINAGGDSYLGPSKGSPGEVLSRKDFLHLFLQSFWSQRVVLLIDDLSELYDAQTSIRDEWLRTFRSLKQQNTNVYAICSVVAAGSFDILKLNPSTSTISSFNVANGVQNPHFTVEDVRKLFREFAQDNHITIDDAVVEDIWAKSNGHPATVCLCGHIVSKNLLLLDGDLVNVSNQSWQQFAAHKLYDELSAYNAFGSILLSLARPQAAPAVALLRSSFVGFLDEVELNDDGERDLADFLTSEGALLKPDSIQPIYHMASPLLDGFIRNRLIPQAFPVSSSSIPPVEEGGNGPHVLGILIESLKFFDKALIRLAARRSYKSSKAKICGVPGGDVPRESVYDTELIRILSNWLQNQFKWTVTGQWHMQTDTKEHKHTGILIEKEDNPTIVLKVLATGDTSFVQSHIQQTPEYMALLSANEVWIVHFTCEQDYHPIWQSDAELSGGVNVVHFVHDLDFTNVVMSTRWKDGAGNIKQETQELTV